MSDPLDLSENGLTDWLRNRPRRVADTVVEMGRMESWVVDGGLIAEEERARLVEALVRLGRAMENNPEAVRQAILAEAAESDAPGFPANLRKSLVYLGAPRRMRILSWLADTLGDGISGFLSKSGTDGRTLRVSLRLLHRRKLLEEMFHPHRLHFILHAIDVRPNGSSHS